MLDPHRTLVFAGAAGGALKRGLLGNETSQNRLFRSRPVRIQISANAQRDFFRIENLVRVERRTMLGAAPALHAGINLKRNQPGDVLAGSESEIFVSGQRRNVT